jgi:hypothetical protein
MEKTMGDTTGKGLLAEIASLSARENELNALCLDYQIDLDAARQEIAALKLERDTANSIADRFAKEFRHVADTLECDNDNESIIDAIVLLRRENDALRQEAADWRNAKAVAESKETAVHLALNDMLAERDALLKVREAADALWKESKTVASERVWNACEAYKEARDGR